MNKKVLLICGTINQTMMMHKISMHLYGCDCYFSPYYADGYIESLARKGMLDFTVLGNKLRDRTLNYLWENNLKVDHYGNSYDYDLVLTCSDLIVQENVKNRKLVLVQEGMTDPKNFAYYLVKWFKFPRYLASTSTYGLSNEYDYFCVASEGYKEMFIKNGIEASKIKVTGLPNYDNCLIYSKNSFPHKHFVLVATSDSRETFKYENRKKFIRYALNIAQGRQLIFKLHPNEYIERATYEINKWAPEALVFSDGNVHEMIANCDVLITKYSTVVYTGLALDKEVHSYFNLDELKKLTPIQNGDTSSKAIAEICLDLLKEKTENLTQVNSKINNAVEYNYTY